jgi:hypothetical protein
MTKRVFDDFGTNNKCGDNQLGMKFQLPHLVHWLSQYEGLKTILNVDCLLNKMKNQNLLKEPVYIRHLIYHGIYIRNELKYLKFPIKRRFSSWISYRPQNHNFGRVLHVKYHLSMNSVKYMKCYTEKRCIYIFPIWFYGGGYILDLRSTPQSILLGRVVFYTFTI